MKIIKYLQMLGTVRSCLLRPHDDTRSLPPFSLKTDLSQVCDPREGSLQHTPKKKKML